MDSTIRVQQEQFARRFNLTLEEYLQVVRNCTYSEVVVVLELMKALKPRSSYRQLRQLQVRRWLDNHLSGKPLTEQQFKDLKPGHPITWHLPR
jgi:hypothetical protein